MLETIIEVPEPMDPQDDIDAALEMLRESVSRNMI